MISFFQYKEILKLLMDKSFLELNVIQWGTPILYFGNINTAKLATLGINPSDKEFIDNSSNILTGINRRFYTLNSLGIDNWNLLEEHHYHLIQMSFNDYFQNNPYDLWFKKLDYIISGSSKSYYFPSFDVCHLDLVPFATNFKWSELTNINKVALLERSQFILKNILDLSSIEILILNGNSVVKYIEKLANTNFEVEEKEEWCLSRNGFKTIKGIAYTGEITKIGKEILKRKIKILGFNHNIQSSFGVSRVVQTSIRDWVSQKTRDYER